MYLSRPGGSSPGPACRARCSRYRSCCIRGLSVLGVGPRRGGTSLSRSRGEQAAPSSRSTARSSRGSPVAARRRPQRGNPACSSVVRGPTIQPVRTSLMPFRSALIPLTLPAPCPLVLRGPPYHASVDNYMSASPGLSYRFVSQAVEPCGQLGRLGPVHLTADRPYVVIAPESSTSNKTARDLMRCAKICPRWCSWRREWDSNP